MDEFANQLVASVALFALAVWLLTQAGNDACRELLIRTGLTEAMQRRAAAASEASDEPAPKEVEVGGLIGSFERALIAIGLLAGAWEVLAAVIALKTVARFKELDERLDAEYFLVGSLFSLVWAVFVVGAWLFADQHLGADLFAGAFDRLTSRD